MAFEKTFGSRAEVWHGTAKKTSGGLEKSKLMKNKHGRIVSRLKRDLFLYLPDSVPSGPVQYCPRFVQEDKS